MIVNKSTTNSPVFFKEKEAAEFSLRLIYPFSFEGTIDTFATSFLDKLTVATLFDGLFDNVASNFQYKRSEDGGYQIVSDQESLDDPEEAINQQKRKQRLEDTIDRYKSEKLWVQPIKPTEYSKDLYDYIQQLLGSSKSKDNKEDANDISPLSRSYELTQDACELINGGAKGEGLALELSAASKSRLQPGGSVTAIPFKFSGFSINKKEKPKLYLFDLGMGFLTVELTIDRQFLQNFGASAAVEFTHTITHINKWKKNVVFISDSSFNNSPKSSGERLQLVNIFELLLGGNVDTETCMVKPENNLTRLFSYASLRFKTTKFDNVESDIEGENKDLELLAYKLSHRQTDHYLPNNEIIQADVYTPFVNIAHGTSVEGGATVINTAYVRDPHTEDGYIAIKHNEGYLRDSLKAVYWPMILVSYLEFVYLIKLTNEVRPDINLEDQREETLEDLERLHKKMLSFRLHYRYSQASYLDQHNKLYQRWRNSFGSDTIANELANDVSQLNSVLSYELERSKKEKQERKQNVFTVLGVFAATLASSLGLFGTNIWLFDSPPLWLVLATFGVFLALSTIAAFMYWKTFSDDKLSKKEFFKIFTSFFCPNRI